MGGTVKEGRVGYLRDFPWFFFGRPKAFQLGSHRSTGVTQMTFAIWSMAACAESQKPSNTWGPDFSSVATQLFYRAIFWGFLMGFEKNRFKRGSYVPSPPWKYLPFSYLKRPFLRTIIGEWEVLFRRGGYGNKALKLSINKGTNEKASFRQEGIKDQHRENFGGGALR